MLHTPDRGVSERQEPVHKIYIGPAQLRTGGRQAEWLRSEK